MNTFFIFCAQYLCIFNLLIAATYFFRQSRERQIEIAVFGLIAAALSYLAAILASSLYNDPRPFVVDHFTPMIAHDAGNGFPSDHALMVCCLAAIMSVFERKMGIILWVMAALVSYARVYTGVHHFTDILGSFFITVIVTTLVYSGFYRRHAEAIRQKVEALLFRKNYR